MTLPRLDAYDELYWPVYDEASQRGFDSDTAFTLITRNQRVREGQWTEWSDSERGAWRRLVLQCQERTHRVRGESTSAPGGGHRNIAEVWQTPQGILFASRIAATAEEWPYDPDRPHELPTAALGLEARRERWERLGARPQTTDHVMRPIVVVRVLLPTQPGEALFARCQACDPYDPYVIDEALLVWQLRQADSYLSSARNDGTPYSVDVQEVLSRIV